MVYANASVNMDEVDLYLVDAPWALNSVDSTTGTCVRRYSQTLLFTSVMIWVKQQFKNLGIQVNDPVGNKHANSDVWHFYRSASISYSWTQELLEYSICLRLSLIQLWLIQFYGYFYSSQWSQLVQFYGPKFCLFISSNWPSLESSNFTGQHGHTWPKWWPRRLPHLLLQC